MSILRTIIEICLLRGRPQDLPASINLVLLTAGLSVVIDFVSIAGEGAPSVPRLLFAAAHTALFGAVIWGALRMRGRAERWLQTITALYAANVVFGLVLLPVLPEVVAMLKAGPEAELGLAAYILIAASVWFLTVMTRVIREAMELSTGRSLLVTIVCILLVQILGFLMTPLFPLTGQP